MKKITWAVFVFVFFLSAIGVVAQGEKENKFDKPSEAKNVKISKKNVLSENERKSFDEIERVLKGKPAKPSPTPDLSAGGATGILGNQIPTGGQRYAILVGMANYAGKINDLCVTAAKTGKNFPTVEDELAYYCKDEDALNMKKALIDEYNYSDSNIFIFSDANARFNAIKSKIDELVGTETTPAKMTANDELVFFFSGHSSTGVAYDEAGLQLDNDEPLDEAMFIYDQDYSEVDYANGINYVPGNSSYIWDDQLRAWFADAPTKRIIFAFDTCNAGGMKDLESDGRVLAMSSTEYQSSMTYYLGGYNNGTIDSPIYKESEGLFAHYFVKRAMTDGLGDGFNPLNKRSVNPLKYDGKVAIEEAFNYAYPIIKTIQAPVLNDKFYNDL
ncbi:MAG: polysaccharide deacetylase, partial [uncultured bacterium]